MPKKFSKRGKNIVGGTKMATVYKAPMLKTNVNYSHKFRFVATAQGTATVTGIKLGGVVGASGTTAATQLCTTADSVRIKSIEMWAPPPTQGSVSTVSVVWNQASAGVVNFSTIEHSDTSNSVAVPAHVKSHPPKDTLAAFWQPTSTGVTLCTLVTPPGTIIDVDLDIIMSDSAAATQTYTAATIVSGVMYYLALDGFAGNNLVPVSLTTTH
jgi:hypothetical protein